MDKKAVVRTVIVANSHKYSKFVFFITMYDLYITVLKKLFNQCIFVPTVLATLPLRTAY